MDLQTLNFPSSAVIHKKGALKLKAIFRHFVEFYDVMENIKYSDDKTKAVGKLNNKYITISASNDYFISKQEM